MDKRVIIDGEIFVAKHKAGAYRYAIELLKELDKIVKKDSLCIILPKGKSSLLKFLNIKVIEYGLGTGILWQQTYLFFYCLKKRVKAT